MTLRFVLKKEEETAQPFFDQTKSDVERNDDMVS